MSPARCDLPLASFGVPWIAVDAPYLNVPPVRHEVSVHSPVERIDGLVAMGDAMLGKPVIDSLLVERTDLMSIVAREFTPTLPAAIVAERYAKPLHMGTESDVIQAESSSDFLDRKPLDDIEISQNIGAWKRCSLAFVPGLPNGGRCDVVSLEPVRDGRWISAEEGSDFPVTLVLNMNHSLQVIGGWLGNTTIEQPLVCRSQLDAISDQPTANTGLGESDQLPDLSGGQSILKVELGEVSPIWSHVPIISVEWGTPPGIGAA